MVELGYFHELEVVAEKNFGMLLGLPNADGPAREHVVLPRGRVPEGCAVGDRLRVFCYADTEGRPVATTKKPAGEVGDFVCLRVVDRNEHGVFMVWGLEKDLFVPKREQTRPMQIGKRYVVALTTDKQNRMMGSGRVEEFLDENVAELKPDQPVRLMAYARHELGIKFVVNNRWEGLAYWDEVYQPIKMGTRVTGYVAQVREDGKVDLRLRETGSRARLEGRNQLLEALVKAGGSLPLHDKSDPDDIKDALHMSKKAFKRAAGNLFKAGLILIEASGIRLVDDEPDEEE